MKIVMDSRLIHLYQKMLLIPLDPRSENMRPNLRVPANEKQDINIIKALYKIKISGARFCKLPSNEGELKEYIKADKDLPECCVKGFDIQKINQRTNELNDPYEDLGEECKLLAEAEECGANIILTTNPNFITNLSNKAINVRILKPSDYSKETNA